MDGGRMGERESRNINGQAGGGRGGRKNERERVETGHSGTSIEV
jgi:hypothetical protein